MNALYATLLFVFLVELQAAVVSSRRNPHKYNIHRPKRIEGSKMWCYNRKLVVRRVKQERKPCCVNATDSAKGRNDCETGRDTKGVRQKMFVRSEHPIFSSVLGSQYQNFSSPGHPHRHYPNNKECVWLFKALGKRRIRLTVEISDFDFAGHSTDCLDYLKIRFVSRRGDLCNATNKQKIVEKKFCAYNFSAPYRLTRMAHLVEVTFVSDSSEQARGFNAMFKGFRPFTERIIPASTVALGDKLTSTIEEMAGKVICSSPNSSRTGSLMIDAVLNRKKSMNAGKSFIIVSDTSSSNKSFLVFKSNASQIEKSLKFYESKQNCGIYDVILKETLKNSNKTVTWPDFLWSNDERPIETKEITEATVLAVATRKSSDDTSPSTQTETDSLATVNKSRYHPPSLTETETTDMSSDNRTPFTRQSQ